MRNTSENLEIVPVWKLIFENIMFSEKNDEGRLYEFQRSKNNYLQDVKLNGTEKKALRNPEVTKQQ